MSQPAAPALLDPFAFPSETRGRFLMLLAAALALAWSLGSYFISVPNLYTLAFEMSPEAQASIDGVRERGSFEGVDREEILEVADSPAMKKFFRAVIYQVLRLPLSILLMVLVVGSTAVLYLLHPGRLRRRHRMRPFADGEAPGVTADLHRLAERAGLAERVSFELEPGHLDGVAFGRRGREVVAVAGHPELLEPGWGDLHRAVVLHELGHVANDDVRNREITRAMWRVVLIAAVVLVAGFSAISLVAGELRFPVLGAAFLGTGDGSPLRRLFLAAVRTGFVLLVMGWLWAELIRARELYADWRVAAWGFREPLLRRLRLASGNRPPWVGWKSWRALERRFGDHPRWRRWRERLHRLWQHGWRHHPSNARRIEALEDPASLFRVTPHLAFLSGLLLTLFCGQLGSFFNDLLFWVTLLATPLFFLVGPLVIFLFLGVAWVVTLGITYLVTSALGVQVQREAVFDLATRRHSEWRYLRLAVPALLFALGLEAGLLATPWGTLVRSSPLETVAWLAGFTGLVWIWFIYLRAMTRLWIGSRVGEAVPKRRQKVLSWVAAFVLGGLLWPALMTRIALHVGSDPELLHSLTRSDTAPQEQFVYVFVMSSIVFFVVALLFYLAVGAVSVLGAGLLLAWRHPRCTACGGDAPPGLVVGYRCTECGRPLARWSYLEPADSGGTAS